LGELGDWPFDVTNFLLYCTALSEPNLLYCTALSEPAVPKAAQEAAQLCLRICEVKGIGVQGRDVSAEIVTSNLRLAADTLFYALAPSTL